MVVVGVFWEEHLAEPDSFDDIFGDVAHLFAFTGIVEEENIWFFDLESVNLCNFAVNDRVVVFGDFRKVRFSVVSEGELGITRQDYFDWLFPLVDTLYTVHGQDAEMAYFLLKGTRSRSHLYIPSVILLNDLVGVREAFLSSCDGGAHFLDQWGLLADILELLFDVFEDLGGIVFSVKDFGHDFHVAVRNTVLVPQLF